ncbi:MAG: hypothetical protein ABIX28_03130 [Vicinamibacterales bacterium]
MPTFAQTDLLPVSADAVETELDGTVLVTAALAAAIGASALVGWWQHLDVLTRVSPNLASMKPTTEPPPERHEVAAAAFTPDGA